MKKIVSLLIAVAMIATFLCTAAFAAGTGVVYGDSNVAAKPGDTVSVTIYISGNPGFDAAGLTASASAPLSVVSVSSGAKMPNGYANGNKVNHFSATPIEGDGVMCTVTVKVAEDAESGTYPVSITGYVTNTDVSVATISGGSVKVPAPEKPTEPQPTEPQPTEPQPTEPQPTETEPTETEPTEKPTETPTEKPTEKPTKPGKDDQPKNGDITPYPVFFLMAVMAVAAVAFVLKRKFDV